MSQGMTPEFAKDYCAMMLDGIKGETEITKKVLAAVSRCKIRLQARSECENWMGTRVAHRQQRCPIF